MTNKLTNRLLRFSPIAVLATISIGITFVASSQFDGISNATNIIQAQSNSTQSAVDQTYTLTAQQRQEIYDLILQRINQINAVLTSSQKVKLRQALKSGQEYGQVFESLNLTAEQKQRIILINNAADLKVKLMATQQ